MWGDKDMFFTLMSNKCGNPPLTPPRKQGLFIVTREKRRGWGVWEVWGVWGVWEEQDLKKI
ncbi:MAG: hypothetical protein SWX82_24655 [Cyanobacteriota bacterium]|nr:hypothetical protein [Cyanobacteriota bacterium]